MTECPICLEHCNKEYCLVCGHFFHKNCLQRWLYQRNTCPVCRQPSTHIIQFHPIRNISRSLNTINSDLEREKSISLDASLNEKRILEEKSELIKLVKNSLLFM